MDVDLCLFTFDFLQDLEADKRNLGRLVARQERELAKYVSTEADLPVILRLGVDTLLKKPCSIWDGELKYF